MKRKVYLLIGIMLFLAACTFTSEKSTITPTPSQPPQGSKAVIVYDSIADFVADFNQVKTAQDSKSLLDNQLATFELKTEVILFPQEVPYTQGIDYVHARDDYIAFYYELDASLKGTEHDVPVVVTWHRDMTPEVHLNGFPKPGAISSKEIVGPDGTTFYVQEFSVLTDPSKTGYLVSWAYDGKSYGAGVPTSFSDEDICKLSNLIDVLQNDSYR